MKEKIRRFAMGLEVDDVGFASVDDYCSPNSPPIGSLFPGVRSMIVLAFRESSACESPSPQMAMGARLDLMDFSKSVCHRVSRYVESQLHSPAMASPLSYPLDFSTPGRVSGEVSLRHEAVAAGLGCFGRHNLVIHPDFGTRVLFAAILTTLNLDSDPPMAGNPCNNCGLCVKNCPAGALNEEGKTDVMKCLEKSQPYEPYPAAFFWLRFGEATLEGQKKLFQSPEYLKIWQAGFIGLQYYCFRCLAVCPIGARPGRQ
jgi:epoxyqueuosine reductase QueG